jgi:phosphonate transport system permease protein
MKRNTLSLIICSILALLFFISLGSMGLLDINRLASAAGRLGRFFSEMFPPQWSIMPQILGAVLETIEISFVGTLLGFIFSLPLAFLGNRVLFGRRTTTVVRLVIGMLRTVPSVLFGIIFVIALGLGKAAGALAVAFYTAGYLSKLLYEAFEAVDVDVIEAVRSTGCHRIQLFRFVILPESAQTIISQLLFMFEYNIRASTIMGFVGAGGIGYYMLGYIQMLQYRHLFMAFLVTLVVVMAIDFISWRLRSSVVSKHR